MTERNTAGRVTYSDAPSPISHVTDVSLNSDAKVNMDFDAVSLASGGNRKAELRRSKHRIQSAKESSA